MSSSRAALSEPVTQHSKHAGDPEMRDKLIKVHRQKCALLEAVVVAVAVVQPKTWTACSLG